MTNIYKIRTNAQRFNYNQPGTDPELTATWSHVFNISADVLEYSLHSVTEDKTYFNIKLTLEDLKSHPRFSAQSVFSVTDLIAETFTSEQIQINASNLVNTLDDTVTSKRKALFLLNADSASKFPMKIFVDAPNGDFTTYSYLVLDPDMTLANNPDSPWNQTTNVETNIGTVVDGYSDWKSLFASITMVTTNPTMQAADGALTVNVTCSNPNVPTIYLEQIRGFLDRTEVAMTNGAGSFNILTETILPGETVKVKAGHKAFTGVSVFSQTLV